MFSRIIITLSVQIDCFPVDTDSNLFLQIIGVACQCPKNEDVDAAQFINHSFLSAHSGEKVVHHSDCYRVYLSLLIVIFSNDCIIWIDLLKHIANDRNPRRFIFEKNNKYLKKKKTFMILLSVLVCLFVCLFGFVLFFYFVLIYIFIYLSFIFTFISFLFSFIYLLFWDLFPISILYLFFFNFLFSFLEKPNTTNKYSSSFEVTLKCSRSSVRPLVVRGVHMDSTSETYF